MALNPWQKAIEDLAKQMGLSGQAQQQVYQTPQFQALIKSFFGNIPLPAGVQESAVTSRTGGGLEYTDPEGYSHRLERDINGVSPRLGQVSETSTNRPAVLPIGTGNPIAPNPTQQVNLNNLLTQTLQSNPSLPLFGAPNQSIPNAGLPT